MRVYVESVFDCSPELVWAEVQQPSLLQEVVRPVIRVEPVNGPFPDRWQEGTTVLVRSYMFGILPTGVRTIYFESVNQSRREIQSREHDVLIRQWDHLVSVRATDDGRTRYSDEIEISGGPLTLFVWAFAMCFYRHRQRKWKRVARRLAAATTA